jgi:hypothetical protein
MKLRIMGNDGLFDAALLVDAPDCSELGCKAALRITWADGDHVFAAPAVAAKRCLPVWATPDEWRSLTEHGFLPESATG